MHRFISRVYHTAKVYFRTCKILEHDRSLSWCQALAAARGAVKKLEATGTKWQRPPDYYAEMVKSDEHMARVKAQLMHEQGEIEGAQERWVLSAL